MDAIKVNKRELIFLIFIVAVAFLLRTAWLEHNLFFGWEQGRDFLKLQEVASGDLVFIGPKTDLEGVFHGALSYYLPLPFFVVFAGNPFMVSLAYIFVNCAAIVFLYLGVREILGKRVASLACVLYAVSYSLIIYSRWISNPNLVPALVILFFYSLVKSRDNNRMLVLAAIFWSVIFHLQVVAAVALFVASVVFLFAEKGRVNRKWLFMSLVFVVLILLPYVLFDFKNQHILLEGIRRNFLTGGALGVDRFSFWDEMRNEVVDGIFPSAKNFALVVFWGALVIALLVTLKNKTSRLPLLFALSAPIIFFVAGLRPLRHFYVTLAVFLPVIVAVSAGWLWERGRVLSVLFVGLVVVGNLIAVWQRLPESKANFIHHSQRTYLGDMLNLLDYMYEDADGGKIAYNYYTFPYWLPQAWLYLFDWYGEEKYGYQPVEERGSPMYTISEPNEREVVHKENWHKEFEKDMDLVWGRDFGQLTLEKWMDTSE